MTAKTTTATAIGNGTKNDDDLEKIPSSVCRFWVKLQRSLPSIRFLGLDVSLTIASSLFLLTIRFIAEYVMITVFGWPSNTMQTKISASSISSIVHSLSLVPTLFILLVQTVKPYYNPSAPMSENTAGIWWEECVTAMLQFCTGYMVYDGFVNIIWLKTMMQPGGINAEDLMFLGHHVATALYMSSTRWVGAGHQSAMMCMFLGEFTNPLHNSYYFAQGAQKFDCCNGPTSQWLFQIITFSFGLLYVIIRAIIGPIFVIHATYNLLTVGLFKVKQLPAWLIVIWILLMWAVLLGSIPWVQECWGFVLQPLPADVTQILISIFGGQQIVKEEL